jgi:hypothetical protein
MWLSLRAILLARLRHGSGRQLIFDPARRNGKNQPHELNCVLTYYHIVAPKYFSYPAIDPSLFFPLVKLSPCRKTGKWLGQGPERPIPAQIMQLGRLDLRQNF